MRATNVKDNIQEVEYDNVTMQVDLSDERIYVGEYDITNALDSNLRETLIYQAIERKNRGEFNVK